MKAWARDTFGSPAGLELRDVEKPELVDDGVLVRVRAASVNPADWYGVTGTPYFGRAMMGLRKPKQPVPGIDFAGTVEAVGKDVSGLEPGDEVFGGRNGALAEYVCVRVAVAHKPANLTFEEAASVPVAALTALQGLRDKGQLQPGQRVLINGASGGVGTFAVQIAKAFGAEVTAVCSTRNVEAVRSLGADDVIDYTREDFTRTGRRYDLLLDVSGNRSWRDYKRVLEPHAVLVKVGAPKGSKLLGPLSSIVRLRLAAIGSSRKVAFFMAKLTKADLEVMRELIEGGQVRPVVEKRYELNEAPAALEYLGEGHAQGKLVITV
jgi:NADPH:quinone reductase-like Zn-dependent oxidoreductase